LRSTTPPPKSINMGACNGIEAFWQQMRNWTHLPKKNKTHREAGLLMVSLDAIVYMLISSMPYESRRQARVLNKQECPAYVVKCRTVLIHYVSDINKPMTRRNLMKLRKANRMNTTVYGDMSLENEPHIIINSFVEQRGGYELMCKASASSKIFPSVPFPHCLTDLHQT